MKGLFIVFEGIDGSGTSTQANLLKDYFTARGERAVISPEPTDGPIGKLLREVLQNKNLFLQEDKFEEQMAYLFAADRHYHLYNDRDGVCKLIDAQVNVITTRYYFSSLAYNCQNEEEFAFVSCLNQRFPEPDLVIYLDIPVEVALDRLSNRDFRDIYEYEEKLIDVRQNYLDIFQQYDSLLLKLDGTLPQDILHGEITNFITNIRNLSST